MAAPSCTSTPRSPPTTARRSRCSPTAWPAFPDGLPIGELRETVALTTADPGYEWVNPLQIWAVGTCDVTTGEVEIAGYAV